MMVLYMYASLSAKQMGCFNHRVVALVADKAEKIAVMHKKKMKKKKTLCVWFQL